jgi:hypothetical protein
MTGPTPKADRPAACRKKGWLARMSLSTAAVLLSLLGACHPAETATDMGTERPDMSMMPDLYVGPSCGKIIFCVAECGVSNLTCSANCFQGATPAESIKAGAIALCAAEHCVGGDGGSSVLDLFTCLLSNCQSQVAECDGLPL